MSAPHLEHPAPGETVQPVTASATDLLQHWRKRTFNTILTAAIVLSSLSLLPAVLSAVGEDRLLSAASYILTYALLWVLRLWHWPGVQPRAWVLITACVLLGIINLWGFGLNGSAQYVFLATSIFAALLLGFRSGIVVLLVGYTALAVAGWATATRQPLFSSQLDIAALPERLASPNYLVSDVLVFITFSLIAFTAIRSVVNSLSRSLHLANQAVHEASTANRQSEQQARELAAQADLLAQQTATLSDTEARLRDLVATLETPTVTLARGVLLAPVVGTIDSQRADKLTRRLLHDASQQHTRIVIIDIAGVATVDAQVATTLLETTTALRLLGCRVVVTGIAPQVAETFISLGFDATKLHTARSPQDVLEQIQPGMLLPPVPAHRAP